MKKWLLFIKELVIGNKNMFSIKRYIEKNYLLYWSNYGVEVVGKSLFVRMSGW